MAHGVGLAGNSRICVLPRRSPDPGVDHFDKAFLQSPSLAYGSTVLGVDGIHYNHEHRRWEISAQVRRINTDNPHPGLLCHSPAIGGPGVASECFRGLQNLPQHRRLAYTRSLVHDWPYWVRLHVYRYVAYPICQQL